VAQSGTGKSEALRLIGAPLFAAEAARADRWVNVEEPELRAKIETIRCKETALRAQAKSEDVTSAFEAVVIERSEYERKLAAVPCIFKAEATREALAELLANQPGEACALISADARGAVGVLMGRYTDGKQSDEDIYLCSYSGRSAFHGEARQSLFSASGAVSHARLAYPA
jgi:hypothetical protein